MAKVLVVCGTAYGQTERIALRILGAGTSGPHRQQVATRLAETLLLSGDHATKTAKMVKL